MYELVLAFMIGPSWVARLDGSGIQCIQLEKVIAKATISQQVGLKPPKLGVGVQLAKLWQAATLLVR